MTATIASIFRHPVKGLTPEPLNEVELTAGKYFPQDRQYAVEVGPSGFDPIKPGHISKMKFTVLARFPELAKLRTRLAADGVTFHIGDATGFGVETRLDSEHGREALAKFLQAFLGEQAPGKLKVLSASGHRFMDHPQGYVSVINLASVRALGKAAGAEVDPLRFRANIYVDGLAPWAEDELPAEAIYQFGPAKLRMFKSIVRCVATHANPSTGERDLETLDLLRQHFGRDTLGNYFSIEQGGRIARGDEVLLSSPG
ncbi:MAG: MOSC domain-containing protein [Hyphomonadaceae bacterium]|nr:MOSC domain-containing protein [Hyphomonadaceae bacterium]